MNADTCIIDRQSICATCLSRDRKLFSVSNLQEFVNFFSKLSLTQTDKVCWECHHMMLRTIIFINRAQKAQAWLQNKLKYEKAEFPCLSTLGISKHLSNTDLELTCSDVTVPNPFLVTVKEDIDDENETNVDSGSELIVKEEIEVEIEMPSKKATVEDLNVEELRADDTLNHIKEPTNTTMQSGPINMMHNIALPAMNVTGLPINTVQGLPMSTMKNMGLSTNIMNNMGVPINVVHNIGLTNNTIHMHNITFRNNEMHLHNLPINTAHNTGQHINAMHNTELPTTELLKIKLPFIEMHEKKLPPTKKRKTEDVTMTKQGSEPDYIYTEESLDEEGLLKWREKKRNMSCFALQPAGSRCDMCIEPFDTQVRVVKHAKTHTELHGDIDCDICKQRVATVEDLENHRKLHYRILKCRYCDFEWDDVNTMREHCSDRHKIKQTLWDCEPCTRQFPSKEKLQIHLRSHRRVRCEECGLQYALLSLKNHMKLHGELAPCKCEVCGRQYRNQEALKVHKKQHVKKFRTIDDLRPELYCRECQVQYQSPAAYRLHRTSLKHMSRDQYAFECEICNKKFPSAKRLQSHMDAMHLDQKKNKCDKCGKSYIKPFGLRRHIKYAHDKASKLPTHICHLCGKIYTMKKNLVEHLYTHEGVRPHQCPRCPATFVYKAALFRHNRLKHLKIKGKWKKKKVGARKEGKEEEKVENEEESTG